MALLTNVFVKTIHTILEHYLLGCVIFDRLTVEDLKLAESVCSDHDFISILANGNPELISDVRAVALDDLLEDPEYGDLVRLMMEAAK